MTSRTFQQHAQGYGPNPAQVTVQIDGNTVFAGTVSTLDQPMPMMPNSDLVLDHEAWSWQDDSTFSGTKSISIGVTGSSLLLGTTLANSVGNAELYTAFYSVDIDGVSYPDPFSDVTIDGIPQSGQYNPDLPGQWWWTIPAGSNFNAIMHVTA